jgi:hypothetical protein
MYVYNEILGPCPAQDRTASAQLHGKGKRPHRHSFPTVLHNFRFREYAMQNVEGFPTFRQILQLPSSGLMTLEEGSQFLYRSRGGWWDALFYPITVTSTHNPLQELFKSCQSPSILLTLKMTTAVCRNGGKYSVFYMPHSWKLKSCGCEILRATTAHNLWFNSLCS